MIYHPPIVKKPLALELAKKDQYSKSPPKLHLPLPTRPLFWMILNIILKKQIKKIKASHSLQVGRMLKVHHLSEKIKIPAQAIIIPIHKRSWIALIADSQWPKTKGSSNLNKNQSQSYNQLSYPAQGFIQSSQLLAAIIKFFPKIKITTRVQSSYCQRANHVDPRPIHKGKYVSIYLLPIDNPQMTRTGDFTTFNKKKGFTVGKS